MNIYKLLAAKQKYCLYQSPQGIFVYQHRQYRWVLFNDLYVQTMIDTKHPKRPILPYLNPMLDLLDLQQGKICLLGLGGGGLVHALDNKNYSMTVVEKFPEMIEVAKQFFFIKETSKLSIICDCAASFLNQTQQQFSHIIIDLGDAYGFPKECHTQNFFSAAYEHLEDHGLLILNLTSHSQIKDFSNFLQIAFKQRPLPIYAQGNWLLVAIKGEQARKNFINQLDEQHLIKTFSWDSELGEQIYLNSTITRGFQKLKTKVLNLLKKAI